MKTNTKERAKPAQKLTGSRKATQATGSSKKTAPASKSKKATRFSAKPKPSSPPPAPAEADDLTEILDSEACHAAYTAERAERRERQSRRKEMPMVVRFTEGTYQEFAEVHAPGTPIRAIIRRFIRECGANDVDEDIGAWISDRLAALIRFRMGAAPEVLFFDEERSGDEAVRGAVDAYQRSRCDVDDAAAAQQAEESQAAEWFTKATGLPAKYSPETATRAEWKEFQAMIDNAEESSRRVRRKVVDAAEKVAEAVIEATGHPEYKRWNLAEGLPPCAARIDGRLYIARRNPDNIDEVLLDTVQPVDFIDLDRE